MERSSDERTTQRNHIWVGSSAVNPKKKNQLGEQKHDAKVQVQVPPRNGEAILGGLHFGLFLVTFKDVWNTFVWFLKNIFSSFQCLSYACSARMDERDKLGPLVSGLENINRNKKDTLH